MSGHAIAVAMRVDASARIGHGHVKRCLSLAHALRSRGASVGFVARSLGVDVAAQVSSEGFLCHTLAAPRNSPAPSLVPHAAWAGVSAQLDATETAAAVSRTALDWIVVDHYAFDAQWHRLVAQLTGSRVAVIDDVADRSLACQVLIDHNLAESHRSKYESCIDAETPILGGPTYALLGPAYAEASRHVPRHRVESIGVFMGGADNGGYSLMALKACRATFDGPIEVVATRGYPHLAALEGAIRQDGHSTLTLDLPELSGFFARHDLQIGAGGGATWERCCIGVATVAAAVADNQRAVLEPLHAAGALALVEPTQGAIARVVADLIQDPSARLRLATRAGRLVDGLGAGRVAQKLMNLCSP
jgi:UDP-2,4-diacetamido-2,4,6-trideoxy-beta-L-altropyranose hydrolase